MPLSEEELRLLEQMEQALAQEDPKFVSTLRGSTLERAVRIRTIGAAAVFVVGVAMMMGGAMAQQVWLGVVGFLVMLGSATLGLAAWRGRHASAGPQPGHPESVDPAAHAQPFDQPFDVIEGGKRPKRQRRAPKQRNRHGTFMQRMEERWERRRRQGF